MDFDEHDNPDEEMGLPPGPKLDAQQQQPGSGHRGKPGGGGKYRECLKNHAVGIGGHAVDGCGEFMPAGEEGTLDALRCAACSCHRNFHRKEPPEGGGGGRSLSPAAVPAADFHHQFSSYYRTPAGYLHHHGHPFMPQQQWAPPPLALPSTSGGGGGTHSRGEEEELSDPMMMGLGGGGGSSRKKRFRTKFTQEQKDKMLAFAERVGWRIQKHDEAAVQQLCNETAVKRHVLKVWMHNNKHTLGKKQP